MRAYADSSFILKILGGEPDTDAAISEYQRAGRPHLFLLNLHELEVTNGILHRAFHQRRSITGEGRKLIASERDRALSRFQKGAIRRRFIEVTIEDEKLHQRAMELTFKHCERIGARAIDIQHVANALVLEAEIFFTNDRRQLQLAEAEGLLVKGVERL